MSRKSELACEWTLLILLNLEGESRGKKESWL